MSDPGGLGGPAGESEATAGGGGAAVRLAARLPEPGSLWIRFYPRRWPGPEHPWVHVGRGTLGEPGTGGVAGRSLAPQPDDVVYLPPVRSGHRQWRDALAQEARRGGVRPLAQIHPGEPAPDPCALALVDPLPQLLGGQLEELREVPRGAIVVWPIVPGLADGAGEWRRALRSLAAAGAVCVQGLVLDLDPAQRRRLAESLEGSGSRRAALFDALFHRAAEEVGGGEGRQRELARAASELGLEPLFARPGSSPPGRTARNRELAGLLATSAELWLRLGRSPAIGQRLFRAARGVDEATVDVLALAREGNLGVLDWLDERGREIVAARARETEVPLLEELWSSYLGRGESSP